jgi:uncharacterized protein
MLTAELIQHLTAAGFKYPEDLIHVFQGGSHQHGASIPGRISDIDLFGVYIERPDRALGVSEETHFTGGTQDQYVRNRPGDEDYKCYTLSRWAGLACKGNPTVLGFLYTSCTMRGMWEDYIIPNKNLFKASSHAKAFLGYAKGQVARLVGDKPQLVIGGEYFKPKGKGKHGQRPELEAAFGYDTKAAMHLMRLMFEAEEYMKTGEITYPRPEKDLLLSIRQGDWTWDKLFFEYNEAEKRVEAARAASTLPEHVDREAVSRLVAKCYLTHWERVGLQNFR